MAGAQGLLCGIGELLTMAPDATSDAQGPLGIIPNAALVAHDDHILNLVHC